MLDVFKADSTGCCLNSFADNNIMKFLILYMIKYSNNTYPVLSTIFLPLHYVPCSYHACSPYLRELQI